MKHEVDHIIPLIHPQVCGLSVPANCQVLTKAQNRRKARRFSQKEQSEIQMQLIRARTLSANITEITDTTDTTNIIDTTQ